MNFIDRLRRLLPGIWFGLLVAIAFVAMPAAFTVLERADAGTLARRIFSIEAPVSLALGALLLIVERRRALILHHRSGTSQFSGEMALVVGALFCTVAGYYALQPMLEAARAGEATSMSFGQLHALSTAFFGVKGLLLLALAWKALR